MPRHDHAGARRDTGRFNLTLDEMLHVAGGKPLVRAAPGEEVVIVALREEPATAMKRGHVPGRERVGEYMVLVEYTCVEWDE